MDSIRIEILNPKAKKLLQSLIDLKLIRISDQEEKKEQFKKLLQKLRSKPYKAPNMREITEEVEEVRRSRYEKKG